MNRLLIDNNHEVLYKENGNFEISIDIFKGEGGLDESKRLGIPLLGNIPLEPEISRTSDLGMPYILKFPDSTVSKIFNKIVSKIS